MKTKPRTDIKRKAQGRSRRLKAQSLFRLRVLKQSNMLQQLNASHAVRYVEWVDAGRMLLLFRCACLRIMQQSLPCTHASSKKLQKRTSTRLRCRQKSGQSLRCKQESHSNAEDCTSLAMVLLLVVDDHLNDNPLHSLFLSPGIKRL